MTVRRAVYDPETQAYVEQPYLFNSVPLIPGKQLDEDVAIYITCVARSGLLISPLSLLFMGDDAEALFLRRNETRANWNAFLAEVVRRHPALAARNAELVARVTALATGDRAGAARVWRPTTPEVCLGSALLDVVPAGVIIVADAALPGRRGLLGHVRRSDFLLIGGRDELRLEAAGLIDSMGRPRTIHGARYGQTTMPARDDAYAELNLPPPVTFHADELLDRARLLPMVAGVVSRLGRLAA